MAITSFIRGFKPTDSREFGARVTIREIVMAYNPETDDWRVPVVCLVNDAHALRKDWDAPVGEKDMVSFVELPMGGGGGGGKSNPLALLVTVVISVLSYGAASWVTGSLLGLEFGAQAGFGLWNLAFALTAGMVMAAGGMLIGRLFKGPAMPSGLTNAAYAESASPTYGLNASNNQARMFQPIGEGFGRMKIVPDRVAQ